MNYKLIYSILICLFIISCNETESTLSNENNKEKKALTFKDLNLLSDENQEVIRILNDINNPKYEIAIIDNPNYGEFSNAPEYDIMISGASKPNISIEIDGNTYLPSPEGQWLKQNIDFKQYYGKEVTINITNGNDIFEFQRYIPNPILVNRLSDNESNVIERNDNELNWIPDSNNPSGKISLLYHLYDNEDNIYKSDAILLEDDGNFSIDEIIEDLNCHKIYFQVISGNTVSVNFQEEKLLFHISTYDHHEYLIN